MRRAAGRKTWRQPWLRCAGRPKRWECRCCWDPMTRALAGRDVKAVHYLDTYILEKHRKEGGMTDDCMRRMVNMVSHACEDGAEGIIIACTIFSQYVGCFRKMFSAPIVAADAAMMERAGNMGGRIALLCTFEGTREISYRQLEACCQARGKAYEIGMYCR